nr:MAG TPA: hypothetical protein [Caudoviricetes sp.]
MLVAFQVVFYGGNLIFYTAAQQQSATGLQLGFVHHI